MKIGLGSYALAWSIGVPGHVPQTPMDAFAFLEFAAAQGFKLVQIADNLPLAAFDEAELKTLKQQALKLELAIELGTRGILAGNLERYLELARFFTSPLLRLVVDSEKHHPEPEEVAEVLQQSLPKFEKAGINLAIENHDRFKAAELLSIIHTLNHPRLGICLDTVKSFGALEGPELVTQTLAAHVMNVHLKDFAIRREPHNMGFRIYGTPAGQGMLNIPKLLNSLPMKEKSISAILELWPEPENSLTQTLQKEKRWVRESANYLFRL